MRYIILRSQSEFLAVDRASEEERRKLLLNSLKVIEYYEKAVRNNSENIPSTDEIATACYLIDQLSDYPISNKSYEFMCYLLHSPSSIGLYAILPEVLALRDEAISSQNGNSPW